MSTPFEPHSGGWSGVPVLPPAWEAERLGGGWIPDFSGWIEPFFPQPGEVRKPTKGNPVPAPGNPEGQVSGVPVLPPAWEAERLGGGWIPDFSGWIEPFFPQPGEVRKPTKGNPVPAPGNPEGQVSGIQSAIVGALKVFVPSRQQMRDVLVYGGAAVLVAIAIWRAI